MKGSGEQTDFRDNDVQAYLDDLMSADERAAFERRLAEEPSLRQRVEQHRAIERSLQRQFTPPSRSQLLAAAGLHEHKRLSFEDAKRGPASQRRGHRWFALAASIAAVALGGWLLFNTLAPLRTNPDSYMAQRSLQAAYQHEVDTGMQPDWVCETESQFAKVFADRFRQPLMLKGAVTGRAAGLAYGHTISRRTVYVLAEVRGKPVIVFVDRRSHDEGERLPESSDLNLFRRDLGPLVLYELTPWNKPALLEDFYIPEKRPENDN